MSEIDVEEDGCNIAQALRDHAKWLLREVERAATALEIASHELSQLRDLQDIVNGGSGEEVARVVGAGYGGTPAYAA